MTSFYDKLMVQPFFKGMSVEELHELLESIPLEFVQYAPDSKLATRGEESGKLCLLLSGEAEVTYTLLNGALTMTQRVGPGTLPGGDRLMGLHTHYAADIRTVSTVGVMRISKPHCLKMLESSRIFLVNYLNYLSFRCQERLGVICELRSTTLSQLLQSLWRGVGDRRALSTQFAFNYRVLAKAMHLSDAEFDSQLQELASYPQSAVHIHDYSVKVLLLGRPE